MKARLLCATVIAALLAVTIPAISQQPAPAFVSVIRIQVKPGLVAEWLEQAKLRAEAYRKAAPADLFNLVCRTAVGNSNEFWVFQPLNKFADRDGEPPAFKFTTPQERATLSARESQYVERIQSSIERVIGDLTVNRSGTNIFPAFVRLNRVRIRPGAANDYINNYKTDVIPIIKKINSNVRVHRIAFGGNTNEFAAYTLFDKWAELDDNTAFLNAVGGEAVAKKLSEKISANVLNNEAYILRVMPDLTYFPAPAAAAPKR